MEIRATYPVLLEKNTEKWSWICIYIFEMHKGNLSGPSSILDSKLFILMYLLFFWLPNTAGGIFVYWPGVDSMLPAVEVWGLNHWTTREVLLLNEYWEIPPYIAGLPSPQENNNNSQCIRSISSVLNTSHLIFIANINHGHYLLISLCCRWENGNPEKVSPTQSCQINYKMAS